MSNSTQRNSYSRISPKRPVLTISRTVKLAWLGCAVLFSACQSTDITKLDEQRIAFTIPTSQLDTSFIGDTVVSPLPWFVTAGCDNLYNKIFESDIASGAFLSVIGQCQFAGNFDLNWSSTNPAVSKLVGPAVQHVEVTNRVQFVRTASIGLGQARMAFTASVPLDDRAKYFHDIVVLPTPDRVDVPDVIVLKVGESTLLTATVRAGTGPGITTGAIVWGPSSSVASFIAVDTVLRAQADGRLVTRSNMSLVIKGLAQGQVVLPVVFKKSVSFIDAASVLAAPVMLQKNVTILVGQSVHIIAVQPDGPLNDLSNALTPVTIGERRQYRLLDQNDAVVPTQFWSSSNSNIAFVATTGVATCLSGGTVTITATKPNSTLSASTSLTCQGTFSMTVLTSPLSVTAGAQPGQLDTVQINRTNFPGAVAITATTDAGITVTASPASTTGNQTILTVTASSSVLPGDHSVLLTGTSGSTVVTKTFLVRVVSPTPSPTLAVNPTSLQLPQGQTATVTATVTNASGTSPVTWVSKDTSIVTVSPASVAALATGAPTTFTGVKAGGPVDVVATYTANGVTVTKTVPVTVTAPAGNIVTAMFLDPLAAKYTDSTGGNFYRARLFDAQGNEVSASSDGGVIRYGSSDNSVIVIDPSSGLAIAKATTATKTATLTATYTKGGQTIATATSAVTVYKSGTAGYLGAVQFSVAGDVRRIKIGQTIQFQVVVRDKNGIQQLPGQTPVPVLTTSDGAAMEITPVASTGGFFFNMRAKAFPVASALTGIANAVSIKADTEGAMATIPMVIIAP